ncbi:MAG TPA: 2-C-methyl-D-erythritol 4-phosphate cytidylyltransferase, partial [Bacteroidetes bacterium]|nr:2-C-methyl-D-erythritol 4-phosphate cytidylyltransferase [Bacteroidota bacterium]
GKRTRKQFLRIGDKPILFYSLHIFEQCAAIDEVVLVIKEEDLSFAAETVVDRFNFHKVQKIVSGGEKRQNSVFAGLQAVDENSRMVVIHDGVRPFITVEQVELGVQKCVDSGAVISAVPVVATIKKATGGKVVRTINRDALWEIQTPQIFNFDLIYTAYSQAFAEGFPATDDAMMVERLGGEVHILPGDRRNIKITTPEDLHYANFVLENKLWPG